MSSLHSWYPRYSVNVWDITSHNLGLFSANWHGFCLRFPLCADLVFVNSSVSIPRFFVCLFVCSSASLLNISIGFLLVPLCSQNMFSEMNAQHQHEDNYFNWYLTERYLRLMETGCRNRLQFGSLCPKAKRALGFLKLRLGDECFGTFPFVPCFTLLLMSPEA